MTPTPPPTSTGSNTSTARTLPAIPEPSLPHNAATIAEAMRSIARPTSAESLDAFIALAPKLTGWTGASLTALSPEGQPEALAASTQDLQHLAAQELELDQGPSLEAARTTFTVVETNLATCQRWPRWTVAAAQAQVGACLSLHLFTDVPLGGLTFFFAQPREFTHRDLDTALTLAAHASTLMAHLRTEQELWRAVGSRNVIGIAQGILMNRYQLTAEAAFALLTRASQNTNRKVSAIAADIAHTGEFDPQAATAPSSSPTHPTSRRTRRHTPHSSS